LAARGGNTSSLPSRAGSIGKGTLPVFLGKHALPASGGQFGKMLAGVTSACEPKKKTGENVADGTSGGDEKKKHTAGYRSLKGPTDWFPGASKKKKKKKRQAQS